MDSQDFFVEGDNVFIALGSNLGNRDDYLDRSLELIEQLPGVTIKLTSMRYETRPIGLGTKNYLNMAAKLLVTGWEPVLFLRQLHKIETKLGRTRDVWWGDRTIDLDILLWEDIIWDGPGIRLPHPRMHERDFVLKPLLDIAPNLIHPLLEKNIKELYDAIKPSDRTILL